MSNQQLQTIQLNLSQYRYLYCVDLEATCDELMPGEPSRGLVVTPGEMETIELGLVVIDQRERRVAGSFQSFVRPRLHPQITSFCRQLTTIEQSDIDSAPGFVDAMQRLSDFASVYAGAAWLSWGKYDATQIRRDGAINQTSCLLEKIPHFNVKDWFEQVFGERPGALKPTVEQLGLAWAGTYHRGIDDANNVAAVVLHLLGQPAV
ncbi:exonuclease [Pseudomonas putida S12]|uniref:Exonuclease n=1 Tax=Pseudomonas putida S12 TaxID=1215087 RepID=A0AA34RYZ0_PSEPU|nr:3'-5' exonuclease [Pseudomonas putida]AJA15882.1 exonuclease [Pseudomonas putida S12]